MVTAYPVEIFEASPPKMLVSGYRGRVKSLGKLRRTGWASQDNTLHLIKSVDYPLSIVG